MKILIIEEVDDLGASIKEYLEEMGHEVKHEREVSQLDREIVENFDACILGIPNRSFSTRRLEELGPTSNALKSIILDPLAVVSRTTQNHIVVLSKPFCLKSLALALV